MTRLEALEKVAEAAREILVHFLPGHIDHVSKSKCGSSLIKALEDLDKIPRVRKNCYFTKDCSHDDIKDCIEEHRKWAAEI